MADPNEQHLPGDPSALYTTILTTGIITLVFFVAAVVLRKLLPQYYLRKCYVNNRGRDVVHPDHFESKTWLSWIPYVLMYNEEDRMLPNYTGLEQVLYLRFLKYAFFLFSALALLNTPLLMGLYSRGGNKNLPDDDPKKVAGLNIVTMSNLGTNDSLMWAPLVMTCVTIIAVWVFVYQYAKKAVELSIRDGKKKRPSRSTVIIREVPLSLRTDVSLYHCLSGIYNDGEVIKTHIIPEADKLRGYQEDCLNMRRNLRTAVDYNAEKKADKPNMMTRNGICGPKIDAVDHYNHKVESTTSEVEQLRISVMDDHSDKTPMAVAIFRRSINAVLSSQTVHRHPWNMSVTLAPDVNSMIWKNTKRSLRTRFFGTLLSLTLVVLLFLFWPIPITFLSGIMNLSNLAQIPGMSFIIKLLNLSPWLTGIIEGVLPTLAIRLFFLLLAFILRSIHSIEFPLSETTLDRSLLKSYWAFILFNVFFVCVISGALFKSVVPLTQNPMQAPNLLAAALPPVTTFFINYILVNIAGHFQFMSRVISLLISKLLRLFSKTQFNKKLRDVPGPFNFSTKLADEILVFSIALVYTTIGPLANIFAAMFFFSAYFTTKHNFMYSLTPGYEGQKFLPITFSLIFASMIIFEVLMMFLFFAQSFAAGIIILPFIILTVGFFFYVKARFIDLLRYPPIDYLPTSPLTEEELVQAVETYKDPALREPKEYFVYPEIIMDDAVPLDGDGRDLLDFSDVSALPKSV